MFASLCATNSIKSVFRKYIFSPVVAGRSYTVEHGDSLAAGLWGPLAGSTQSDDGPVRAVIDNGATGPKKFYRVEIENP